MTCPWLSFSVHHGSRPILRQEDVNDFSGIFHQLTCCGPGLTLMSRIKAPMSECLDQCRTVGLRSERCDEDRDSARNGDASAPKKLRRLRTIKNWLRCSARNIDLVGPRRRRLSTRSRGAGNSEGLFDHRARRDFRARRRFDRDCRALLGVQKDYQLSAHT